MVVAVSAFDRIGSASGVRVSDGAIALTRTPGTNSAAGDIVSPLIALLAAPINA
jgi:hypothetical protein